MLAVCIATYNHETFIARAIESVKMQVTDEDLRIYIGDDASTDGTAAICLRYAAEDTRIRYIRRTHNIGLVSNTIDLYRLIMAEGCEYIAMLDGDDYWCNKDKIQLQLNYLRSHPDTGLVHTGTYEARRGQHTLAPDGAIESGDLSSRYDLAGARHTNCSVVFRTALLRQEELDELDSLHFPVLDYPLYGLFCQRTLFGYLPTPTAVWTCHESVSQPRQWTSYLRYKKERIRMWKWLDSCYPKRFHYSKIRAIKWFLLQIVAFLYEKMQ